MSTLKRIAKNAGFVFIGDNALKILTMILVFLIARYLGAEEYGKFSFVISFASLFFILLDLGTRILIVRDISQNKEKTFKIVSNVIFLKIITSIFIYGVIIFVTFFLNYENATIYAIAIAALGVLFDSFSSTFESVFQAYERLEIPAATKIIRILIRFIATVPLLINGAGFISILIVLVLVQFLNLVISAFLSYKFFVKFSFDFDRKLIISIVKRSFPFLLSGIFFTVYFRIDITMMSKIAPLYVEGLYSAISRDAVIGWYSAAYNLIDGLISIPIAVSVAMLPVFYKYVKTSTEKFKKLYILGLKYLVSLSIPICVGTSLLSQKIILLIYGPQYNNSILALQILIWALIFTYPVYILSAVAISLHKEKETLYVLTGNAILNIGLNFLLIPKFGLYGAAISTVITEIFYFIGYYYIVSRHFIFVNILSYCIKPLISSVFMTIVIQYFYNINLFILIFISSLCYFLILLLLNGISPEDISLFKKIYKKSNP